MTYKSDLIQIFSERGYIHQATDLDGIDGHAADSIMPTYIGFDCTADSLHVGSLVQIMMLRILGYRTRRRQNRSVGQAAHRSASGQLLSTPVESTAAAGQ